MRQAAKIVMCLTVGLGVWSAASGIVAEDGGNPYSAIVTRNIFGLRPKPVVETGPEVKKADPPKIVLTGVTTITGVKRVLFKVQMPARPPEPAKEQSFIMREGDIDGQIQVLEIDEKAGAIKFNNYGTEMVLTMEKDAAKLPNTPPVAAPPPGVPGQPPGIPTAGVPIIPQQPPLVVPAQQPVITVTPGANSTGMRTIPTREIRPQIPRTPGGPPPPP